MNIQILDSWLREFLKTKATPKQLGKMLSLASVSFEKIQKHGEDYIYDIEITTNRPDLMSITGLAREAAAVLSQNGIDAKFTYPSLITPDTSQILESITIKNNPKLVHRICCVVMDVKIKKSPKEIQERLESTGIRSISNIIDITNYVMRVIGHPTHVFDFEKLPTKTINIRESRPHESIKTLDGKTYDLKGGDIVADDGLGNIIDLLGIMGLKNSVVSEDTKRILFFIDNNDPHLTRKTSMTHGIRTEAAVLNEKGIDPELAMNALLYGIQLFKKFADGKVISLITDIYPKTRTQSEITVTRTKINSVIGLDIQLEKSIKILNDLDFSVERHGEALKVVAPSFRSDDINIEEDVIEEIARIYGYHNVPNRLPAITTSTPFSLSENKFYFENRIKDALKYWGFIETYTYPMVSEEIYEGSISQAVTIKNPLNEEYVYMRKSLVPSLLKVVKENKTHKYISIFEIANTYEKNNKSLPNENLTVAAVIKKPTISFYEIKGIIQQMLADIGISDIDFKSTANGMEVSVNIQNDYLGNIEILDKNTINFELNFDVILKHAKLTKVYNAVSKFPPIFEDMSIIASTNVQTREIINSIKNQSELISEVTLLDKYQDTRTFHIIYQSDERNLKNKEIEKIREKIIQELKMKLNAKLKI